MNNQHPTYVANIPDVPDGDGEMAIKLTSAYFEKPMEWQKNAIAILLARNSQDKYAAKTVGISIARQNGKSWVVRARCFYGLISGEKILYTCQHGDTSDEMFRELSKPFEDEDNAELHAMLEAVRKTNGQQAIRLNNGGLIRFTTRTESIARGKTYDVIVYDEAQELTTGQQAASLPAVSAGAKHNPQVIYMGTPHAPGSAGTVFRDMRDRVRAGSSKTVWIEWAADEIGAIDNEERWARYNPALGTLIDVEAVRGECDQMLPAIFARERLGWWSPVGDANVYALSASKWDACVTTTPPNDPIVAFGVKFAPDGAVAAVSWSVAKKNRIAYVELHDIYTTSAGTLAISDMLLKNKKNISGVLIDGKSHSSALIQRLIDGGFSQRAIVEGTPVIVQRAAALLKDEVEAATVSHIASPLLDESAKKSIRRKIGKDGWGFGDGINVSSTPIESASLALFAARNSRRNPTIVQEASF